MKRRTPAGEASRLTKLWQSAGPNQYPIDLAVIVREVVNKSSDGDVLEIKYSPFDTIDGALVSAGRRWLATINSNILHMGRRRFTLAHELGHFCCHRYLQSQFDCTPDMIDDFTGSGLEDEANQFASDLLLPPNRVREYTRSGRFNFSVASDVATNFGVSLAAAGLKAVNLSTRKCAFFLSRDGFIKWGRASEAAYKLGVYFKSAEELPAFLDSPNDAWSGLWMPRSEFGSELEFKATRQASDRTGIHMTCLDFGM